MDLREKIDAIWKLCNEKLGHFGTGVVLAGGCARDVLLDKEPRDWDLFIMNNIDYLEIKPEVQKILDEIKAESNTVKKELENLDKNGKSGHYSKYLIDTIEILGSPIQVITTPFSEIHYLLKSFDFNVCLFSYGKNGFYNLEDIENCKPGKELKIK